jgi:hypothetical protein
LHPPSNSRDEKLLRIQTPETPAEVRNAIVDILDEQTSDIRIASAYVTLGGSDILFGCLSEFLTQARIDEIPKTLVTCFDYGITEPAALDHWSAMPNAIVRVAGADLLASGSLTPSRAFHPKIYAFGVRSAHVNLLVGSPNMTSRGFSINTEAVWLERNVATREVDDVFSAAATGTVPLSNELLSAYKSLRQSRPPPPELRVEAERVPPPRVVPSGQLRTFRSAIESGAVDPKQYNELWIQVEALQGGSRNQLELPRKGYLFFGLEFEDYDSPKNETIGVLVLRAGARVWDDRPITWHGDNKMERINLPTRAQGGFAYENSAILFRRLPDHSFELVVAPWDSDLARSWRDASARKNLLFRLGARATRLVGLI